MLLIFYGIHVLQDKNDEEVFAVIAHELGHWKLNQYVPFYVAMQVCVITKTGYNKTENCSKIQLSTHQSLETVTEKYHQLRAVSEAGQRGRPP